MYIGNEWTEDQTNERANFGILFLFIYLFLMFSFFTSPARSQFTPFASCTMCELSGKLVKSLRVFPFTIFCIFVYFPWFWWREVEEASSMMCYQSVNFCTPEDHEKNPSFSCSWVFFFSSVFILILCCRFSCQLLLLLRLLFFVFVNTLDAHYNSSSVYAMKYGADIKVQRYSTHFGVQLQWMLLLLPQCCDVNRPLDYYFFKNNVRALSQTFFSSLWQVFHLRCDHVFLRLSDGVICVLLVSSLCERSFHFPCARRFPFCMLFCVFVSGYTVAIHTPPPKLIYPWFAYERSN